MTRKPVYLFRFDLKTLHLAQIWFDHFWKKVHSSYEDICHQNQIMSLLQKQDLTYQQLQCPYRF